MKKLTAAICLLLILTLLPILPACQAPKTEEKITILCTLFPQYDWVKNIVGDSEKIEVKLLIKNGTDPHSYQPTAADIMAISSCDMIIYQGGASDLWVQEALDRAKAQNIVKVALSEMNGITLRPISSSSHSHGEHDHDHDHGAYDEHLWLSLSNAEAAARGLTDEICKMDSENSSLYKKNASEYIEKLNLLDKKYRNAAESARQPFVLFADRFPFVYLLEDYGIDYAAAFEGCSADVDAGFDTVLSLIKEADEHSVDYIAVTESSDKALALTVANSAKGDIQILVMNSLQSVTARQIEDGTSYLSVMKENLAVLKKAIGAN